MLSIWSRKKNFEPSAEEVEEMNKRHEEIVNFVSDMIRGGYWWTIVHPYEKRFKRMPFYKLVFRHEPGSATLNDFHYQSGIRKLPWMYLDHAARLKVLRRAEEFFSLFQAEGKIIVELAQLIREFNSLNIDTWPDSEQGRKFSYHVEAYLGSERFNRDGSYIYIKDKFTQVVIFTQSNGFMNYVKPEYRGQDWYKLPVHQKKKFLEEFRYIIQTLKSEM